MKLHRNIYILSGSIAAQTKKLFPRPGFILFQSRSCLLRISPKCLRIARILDHAVDLRNHRAQRSGSILRAQTLKGCRYGFRLFEPGSDPRRGWVVAGFHLRGWKLDPTTLHPRRGWMQQETKSETELPMTLINACHHSATPQCHQTAVHRGAV